jgi:hypothetical protein
VEKRLKRERAEAKRTLTERLQKWEQQGVWELVQRERREAFQQEAAGRLAPLQQRKRKAEDAIGAAFASCERACQRERELLRELEDLANSERMRYELAHAKDQTMTVLKLALANLVLWTRDRSFPATYKQPQGVGWTRSFACLVRSSGAQKPSRCGSAPSTIGI